MWPVREFWKISEAFSFDLICNKFHNMFSMGILCSSFYSLYNTPEIVKLDGWPDRFTATMARLCFRVFSITTFLSRLATMYHVKYNYVEYQVNQNNVALYSQTSGTVLMRCKLFSLAVIVGYLLLSLPVNLLRLYYMYDKQNDVYLMVYLFCMCMQTLSMCSVETHFAVHCFVTYVRFREISDDLAVMEEQNPDHVGFLFLGLPKPPCSETPSVLYEKDFFRPNNGVHPMTNVIELLRIRYSINLKAFENINRLFGIQLGLSMVSLSILSLFDVYNEVFYFYYDSSSSKSVLLLYGLVLQYSFRVFTIIIISHVTTKQALKAKSLITDINNRYLDNSTKDELHLFLEQIRTRTIEFTACDFFTLNTHLITSAIAVGATYLVILVQFHSGKN